MQSSDLLAIWIVPVIDCVNMKWKNTFQAEVILPVTALDPPPLVLAHMHNITNENETSRSVRDGIYNAGYLSVC